eukprot:37714_1
MHPKNPLIHNVMGKHHWSSHLNHQSYQSSSLHYLMLFWMQTGELIIFSLSNPHSTGRKLPINNLFLPGFGHGFINRSFKSLVMMPFSFQNSKIINIVSAIHSLTYLISLICIWPWYALLFLHLFIAKNNSA